MYCDRLQMDVNGENMDKKWRKETRALEPITVAPWPLAVPFGSKYGFNLLSLYVYQEINEVQEKNTRKMCKMNLCIIKSIKV